MFKGKMLEFDQWFDESLSNRIILWLIFRVKDYMKIKCKLIDPEEE